MFKTDVIGIMTDHEVHVNDITNRHGVRQEQAKFVITDGRLALFWQAVLQKYKFPAFFNLIC